MFSILGSGAPQLLPFALKHSGHDETTVYYLDKPCVAADEVKVAPWWDLTTEVRICKDAFRPDVKIDDHLGAKQLCEMSDASYARPNPVCRCGEHLINCARDGEQRGLVSSSHLAELLSTFRHVMTTHQRFEEVLTMRASVRSDLADFFYARSRYLQTGKLTLAPIDEKKPPSLRDRDPENAGVLTNPVYLYRDSARRIMTSVMWDD